MSADESPAEMALEMAARDAESVAEGPPTANLSETSERTRLLGSVGRFELMAVLGQGGFGRVYRAWDPQLEREVALKVPRFDSPGDNRVDRFLSEAKAAAQLRHPNIVPIYESGQEDGQYFIASQLVSGRPLSECLASDLTDFRQAAEWVHTLAAALAYAHGEGIVHRDIKPGNIMLDENEQPQIMDFGLAKRLNEDSSLTTEGCILGTPAYMAPEQARGELDRVGPQSDQYSLGVVLYEMLTGRRPFEGPPHAVLSAVTSDEPPSPSSIERQVPPDLEAVCLKAMEKSPADRYASCGQFAGDLDRWLRGETLLARPLGVTERGWRWVRRNRMLTGLIVSLVAGISFSLFFAGQWRDQLQEVESARTRITQQHGELQTTLTERNSAYADLARQMAESDLNQGLAECEEGRIGRGLLYFARALETVPDDAENLAFTIRANIDGWLPKVNRLVWQVEHDDPVVRVQISPDRKLLAVTGYRPPRAVGENKLSNMSVSTWIVDAETGRRIGEPIRHLIGVMIYTISFSVDSRSLITTEGGAIYQRLVDSQENARDPISYGQGVTSAGISPDRSLAVTIHSAENSTSFAQIWDLRTGERGPRTSLDAVSYALTPAFTPDSRFVVIPLRNYSTVLAWDIEQAEQAEWKTERDDSLGLLVIADQGLAFISAGVYDLADLQTEHLPDSNVDRLQAFAGLLSIAPSTEFLAFRRSADASVARLWNYGTGRWLGQPLPATVIEISPDGRYAVTATGTSVRTWAIAGDSVADDDSPSRTRATAGNDPALLTALIELTTGMSLRSGHDVQLLELEVWEERRVRLQAED